MTISIYRCPFGQRWRLKSDTYDKEGCCPFYIRRDNSERPVLELRLGWFVVQVTREPVDLTYVF